MKRRKSIVSHAASISAWCAVFDWLSIVAALSVERHGPDEQLGGAEEDRDALVPRRRATRRRCASRAAAIARSTCDGVALRDVGEHVVVVVRHDRLERRPGLDPLAADHERDVDPLAGHLREPLLELGALGRARRVRADRLVDGGRRAEDPGGAHRGRL